MSAQWTGVSVRRGTRCDQHTMELKLWMERKHGGNVWQHMWDLMLNLIGTKTPGKKGLYEMQDTRYVRCACVWAIGAQHHQQAGHAGHHDKALVRTLEEEQRGARSERGHVLFFEPK